MTWRVAGVLVVLVWIPWTSWAQVGPPERLKVFVDCEECFLDYLQEEIEFVDHVRDPADADVHVILTTAETGAEGTEYSADFSCHGSRLKASSRGVSCGASPILLRAGRRGYAIRSRCRAAAPPKKKCCWS